jgi:site-specific DNA-methyltransferase (adenine-specific)
MEKLKVFNGDNIELLKQYPDNYFDAIVTDPPYGLGKEPNAEALMKDWIEKGYHEISGKGFMGKEWDAFVPQPIFWKEVFRVLKHGGHVVSFFGTRTYDWGVMAMRFAGFEVRDCIQWLYGSGFPKSHNISKAIDKMNGNESEIIGKNITDGFLGSKKSRCLKCNKPFFSGNPCKCPKQKYDNEWDGWGSALKPANEPIVLARKPLEKGLSIAENVLKWGVGAINIDGCRVNTNDKIEFERKKENITESGWKETNRNQYEQNPQGRFPANLILTHHPECECVGTKKVKSGIAIRQNGASGFSGGLYKGAELGKNEDFGYTDENGEETIENWNCHEDCPIKILDQQSGESQSGVRKPNGKAILNTEKGWNDNSMIDKTERGHKDKRGASRFFYVAKASKSERNKGLEQFEEGQTKGGGGTYNEEAGAKYGSIKAPAQNFHPTIKPIKLMQYLVRLITPPNGIVLDPFCGSGTTGIACKLEGFDFVGMEQDAEYCKIAQTRIDNYTEDIKQTKADKKQLDLWDIVQKFGEKKDGI